MENVENIWKNKKEKTWRKMIPLLQKLDFLFLVKIDLRNAFYLRMKPIANASLLIQRSNDVLI